MEEKSKLRVMWIANSPGLGAGHLKINQPGSGWVPALQEVLKLYGNCDLALAFYHDQPLAPFQLDQTWYFPVKRLGNTKKKRFFNRLRAKAEYDENVPAFLQAVRTFSPDIIHIHGTEQPFGLILRHLGSIPAVISIQGILTAYEKKYFSGLPKPGLLQQIRSGYPFFTTDHRIWQKRALIEQEILSLASAVFGRTDWDRQVCRVLAPNARYFHLDEVIRKPFYLGRWKPGSNQVPVLFTTTSPSLYKGFENILDTAAILTASGISFRWQVAGLKEQDAMVSLILGQRKVRDLQSLHIELLGTLSEKEHPGFLRAADLYIQVSHIENSPNSLCEAMLAGMPVIASFAGGTRSLLLDNVQGTLVQDGDPYALAGCIDEMLRNPERCRKFAEEAFAAARKRHDPETIVSEMINHYHKIIALKKTSPVLQASKADVAQTKDETQNILE